jgi:hypothetical protein
VCVDDQVSLVQLQLSAMRTLTFSSPVACLHSQGPFRRHTVVAPPLRCVAHARPRRRRMGVARHRTQQVTRWAIPSHGVRALLPGRSLRPGVGPLRTAPMVMGVWAAACRRAGPRLGGRQRGG